MTIMTSRTIAPAAPTNWRDQALCQGADPELFFSPREVDEEAAKRICRGCPVMEICLEEALVAGPGFGVWGGATETDRKTIIRRRQKARKQAADAEAGAGADVDAEDEGCDEADAEAAPAAEVEDEPSERLMDDWLEGELSKLPADAEFLAIARGVARGMSLRHIDHKRSKPIGTTSAFVSRIRKEWEREKREVPTVLKKTVFRFTDEEVLKIRVEFAGAGIPLAQMADRYRVNYKTMRLLLNGENFAHVGGPLRAKRTGPSVNSRVMWSGGQERFLKTAA